MSAADADGGEIGLRSPRPVFVFDVDGLDAKAVDRGGLGERRSRGTTGAVAAEVRRPQVGAEIWSSWMATRSWSASAATRRSRVAALVPAGK